MGLSWAEQSAEVAAPPDRCFEALADFESYPEWQQAVERAEVLERHPDGSGRLVEVHVDAKLRRVRYRLIYHHEPPHRLWWEFVEGDGVEAIEGEYELEPAGAGTIATYRLGVDAGVPLPGLLARKLTSGVMRRSVHDLKRRVEASG